MLTLTAPLALEESPGAVTTDAVLVLAVLFTVIRGLARGLLAAGFGLARLSVVALAEHGVIVVVVIT